MSLAMWRFVVMLIAGFGAIHLGAPEWAAFLGSLIVGFLAMPENKQG